MRAPRYPGGFALLGQRWHRWVRLALTIVIGLVIAVTVGPGLLPSAAAAEQPAAASTKAAEPMGSYEVAPVRILGVPAISVASPVVSQQDAGLQAMQRAAVIEGNLSLLYAPHQLCDQGEAITEALLEGLVLGGPDKQRLCSGDPWLVLGKPDDLHIDLVTSRDGSSQLQARLQGRSLPLPLLTVTEADAQLHGLSQAQLASRWRQLLQRRLRHARLTEQPSQVLLRLKVTLLVELVLLASVSASLWLWGRLRRRLRNRQKAAREYQELQSGRAQLVQGVIRLLFLAVLVQLVLMVGLAVAAAPGHIPLAIRVLLQPLSILFKVLGVGIAALALRLLVLFVLRQWVSNLAVPLAERARREQRYHNLMQASQRLIDLAFFVVLGVLVLLDIPGVRELTAGAWLAGGALLGGLAIAFQGLLRDLVAGLVALLDDHYAVGDVVEINGISGEVVDVGLLVTELRTADQRVVVVANSASQLLLNHTKIRSGVDVVIPLSTRNTRLDEALALIEAECTAFAADPAMGASLLQTPCVRGVSHVSPQAVEISVLLTTRTGEQWAAERALLRRLVVRLQGADIPLASPASAPSRCS
jgi:small conductance mechanosensitive channel